MSNANQRFIGSFGWQSIPNTMLTDNAPSPKELPK
jgi:hypothetical protein